MKDTRHRLRILLVEEDPALREVVGQLIGKLDGEVVEAPIAEAGIGCPGSTAVDLVLTDLHMPGSMEGLELASAAIERGIPAVVMTASADRSVMSRIRREGIVLLRKPFGLRELRQALRRCNLRLTGPCQ